MMSLLRVILNLVKAGVLRYNLKRMIGFDLVVMICAE
jgi:hypothetical protein